MRLRISIRWRVRPLVRWSVRWSVGMSRFCKKCMKLRVLCTEMILKAYKVMNNIKTALKLAIAVLRFPPRISHISFRGYAKKSLRTHRWPLGLVFFGSVYGVIRQIDKG